MSIEILTEMSNRYGSSPEYVLAGGGNTSYKDETTVYVKGSGTQMGTMGPHQFVAMDMQKLKAMLETQYPQDEAAREAAALADMMDAKLPGQEDKRPSVEAILHALFPYKYVLHVHPALVNGLSCSQEGEAACTALLGEDTVWIPLTKPGYILAAACHKAFAEKQRQIGSFPQVAILQNHGIFVAADTVEEIDASMDKVMAALGARLTETPDTTEVEYDRERACAVAPALRMLYSARGEAVATFRHSRMVREFTADKKSMEPLMEPFTPDHIVYCKDTPLFVEYGEDYRAAFADYTLKKGAPPKIVAVGGLGFFALGKNKKEADIAGLLFLDAMKVAVYSRSFGGPLSLPRYYTDFILNWEFESYRQKVALSSANPKRLAGKIAIVTGGAQGFGKGIAQAMAAQGAYIVVADMNLQGARACCAELEGISGPGGAYAVGVNVADEASVRSMVEEAVLGYGGLDILVSNAGIAIAGSLPEMTKEKFEKVTAVNYTGYFLCTKYCCEPMKLQRQYSPEYLMDIIEINSKSGLTGSNKNFAYAGSKFGGVGLTQSFAMELVEFGVKVNAICPGNLLDGPLWSDPEKGLFRQYFDAGKVPGAKSVADVRAYYEAKVPMKRGCTTDDVACAILYIVEQKYETGQAVPVTGGQIMLK